MNYLENEDPDTGDSYKTYTKQEIMQEQYERDKKNKNGHAVQKIKNGYNTYNLGTGKGTSVKEIVDIFEKVNGVKVEHKFVDRRNGDLETVYCDPVKAKLELCWETKKDVNDMCKDAWNFAKNQMF